MPLKKIGIYILLLLFGCGQHTNAQTAKQLLYDFTVDTLRSCVNYSCYTEDSFYIAGGGTVIDTGKQASAYLAKFDYNLNLQKKVYLKFAGRLNGIVSDKGAIGKISNDKYAVVGVQQNYIANTRGIVVYQSYIHLFNSNLDSLSFQGFYSDTIRDRTPYSIVIDKQKNILVSGQITSATTHLNSWDHLWYHDSTYVWVAKYDSNARLIWEHTYFGYKGNVIGYKIVPGNDDTSYVIAGMCVNPDSNKGDDFFAKIDSAGNLQWQKFTLKSDYSQGLIDITPCYGGYAFVSSLTDSLIFSGGDYYAGNSYFYYGKINENGDTLWTKRYRRQGYWCEGHRIIETKDRDLLLLGIRYYAYDYPAVIRTTVNGDVQWYREYTYNAENSHPYNTLYDIDITNSKQILLSGYIRSPISTPDFDTVGEISWYVLTDTFGCVVPGCELGVENIPGNSEITVKVWPNPFSNEVTIEHAMAGEVILFDVYGRALYQAKLNADKQVLYLPNIHAGMYIMQVVLPDKSIQGFKLLRE